jgi:N-acetylneuraminic acid mutarotase
VVTLPFLIKAETTESEWIELNPKSFPRTSWSDMVYDSQAEKIILYGGGYCYAGPGDVFYNDTWEYEASTTTWTKIIPENCPPALHFQGMVYHTTADRTIMFGGSHKDGLSDETWEYNSNTDNWTNLNPSWMCDDGRRLFSPLAYDSESDKIILFGGYRGGMLNDVWAYDYNTNSWECLAFLGEDMKPPSRAYHALTYDIESDRVILFGGDHTTETGWEPYGDTWAYDYNDNRWEEMKPAKAPAPRTNVRMVYDSTLDRVILFGGAEYHENEPYVLPCFNETWLYDYNTNTWQELKTETTPTKRCQVNMVYDSKRNKTILYGGVIGADSITKRHLFLNDTWELTITLESLTERTSLEFSWVFLAIFVVGLGIRIRTKQKNLP